MTLYCNFGYLNLLKQASQGSRRTKGDRVPSQLTSQNGADIDINKRTSEHTPARHAVSTVTRGHLLGAGSLVGGGSGGAPDG